MAERIVSFAAFYVRWFNVFADASLGQESSGAISIIWSSGWEMDRWTARCLALNCFQAVEIFAMLLRYWPRMRHMALWSITWNYRVDENWRWTFITPTSAIISQYWVSEYRERTYWAKRTPICAVRTIKARKSSTADTIGHQRFGHICTRPWHLKKASHFYWLSQCIFSITTWRPMNSFKNIKCFHNLVLIA